MGRRLGYKTLDVKPLEVYPIARLEYIWNSDYDINKVYVDGQCIYSWNEHR